MPNTLRTTNTVAVEAFLTLSKVYLTSIERLAALHLTTAREAIESCAEATTTLAEAKAAKDLNGFLSLLGQPAWERALTYSRSTYEIIAKTQEEMSKVIAGQFARPHQATSGLAGWNAMSDMFTKGIQQITTSVSENMAAAAHASAKAVAATTTDTRKAA